MVEYLTSVVQLLVGIFMFGCVFLIGMKYERIQNKRKFNGENSKKIRWGFKN
jgi:hypothetical protein